MSRRIILVLLMGLSLDFRALPLRAQQADISSELSRAEALFSATQFQPAIDLLLDLAKRVENDPKKKPERLKINLYLGLSYLGLNQTSQAKARFIELCSLDDNYTLSSALYATKVTRLFDEAKKSCTDKRCAEVCAAPNSRIDGSPDQVKAGAVGCSCAAPAAPATPATGSVANTFKDGKALYDEGRFEEALKYFDVVLALDSTHELAREYSNLARQQLELGTQRSLADWRASFNARQFDKAAAEYLKIRGAVGDQKPLTVEIEAEYDKTLSGLVSSWKAACTAKDDARVAAIRSEANLVAYGLPFTQARLREMTQCVTKGCIYQETRQALARLKVRVALRLDSDMRRFLPRSLRVGIVIDEKGNVTANNIAAVTPRLANSIKTAVEQWKFSPAIVDNEPRCVETEIVFDFSQQD